MKAMTRSMTLKFGIEVSRDLKNNSVIMYILQDRMKEYYVGITGNDDN